MSSPTSTSGGRRRTVSRLASVGLTLASVAGILWWLSQNRDAVVHAVGAIPPWVLIASAACVACGGMLTMLSWRELAVPSGGRLPIRRASAFFFSTQLSKYLPGGGVWPLVAQSYLADTLGIPRARMATVASVNLGISLLVRLALAAGIAPLIGAWLWWTPGLAVVGVLLLVCVPGHVLPLLSRLPKLRRVDRATAQALAGRIRRSTFYSAAGWTLTGLSVYVLVVATGGDAVRTLYPAVAVLALATCLSSIAVIFPAGIGPRELIMVGLLGQLVDHPAALAITVVSRLVTTVVELAMAAMFRRPATEPAEPAEPQEKQPQTEQPPTIGDSRVRTAV